MQFFRTLKRAVRLYLIRIVLSCCLLLFLLDIQTWRSTFARSPLATPSPPPSISGRVFIASTFWNSEQVLRSHWSTTVLDFARQIGPGRVYVSIYEGGSWDGTKRELRTLDANLDKLQIPRTVVLNDTTHADLMAAPHGSAGWVRTQSRGVQPRRISHLAHARNAALEPLQELAHQGLVFDWILFLNDVIITHGNFAAACALDFSSPPAFYDTFALRDSNGDEVATHTYPYFRSSLSRNALLSGLAIPVQSCWNGAVVFNATPFYKDPRPLRFKAIPDSLAQAHLEGSECCIIHLENPLVPSRGIWLNPLVRVTYDLQAYKHVHPPSWPTSWERVTGIWRNRLARWFSIPTFLRRWTVTSRIDRWVTSHGIDRCSLPMAKNSCTVVSDVCIIDEMQILTENGWAHV